MRITTLAVLAALFSNGAAMAASACPAHYQNGAQPEFTNQSLGNRTRDLCNTEFVVMHSGLSRTPLWSAEHLTRERVLQARKLSRENVFHPDERLHARERSELADYHGSGLDRGHTTPSGDASTMAAQNETFALSNMVPQDPKSNRGVWEHLEENTRNLALKHGDIYVITGPLFISQKLRQLNERVLVPSHLFKVIYDQKAATAAAYLAPNDASGQSQVISVAELNRMAGINFLPGVADAILNKAAELPAESESPSAKRHRRH